MWSHRGCLCWTAADVPRLSGLRQKEWMLLNIGNPASASKAAGRKRDESLIADSPKASTSAKQPKKARKAEKMWNVEISRRLF